MELYYMFVFFFFGTILGSFFNVVGYRLPREESIMFPASHCPKCKHQLTAIELIPVLSYLIQGGKCKKCKTKISMFYPLFEIFTGILFASCYFVFGLNLNLILALIFVSTLVIVIISDYQTMIIPDELLITSGIMLGIVILIKSGATGLLNSLLDGTAAFMLMFLIKKLGDFMFKKESMGGGDIKLLFIFGMYLGISMSIISIFLGSIIGLPISIAIYLKNKEHVIPFGPFLSAGALVITLFQLNFNQIITFIS